jgi:hypothetical protein
MAVAIENARREAGEMDTTPEIRDRWYLDKLDRIAVQAQRDQRTAGQL